jgi:hypothetical protein
MEILNYLLAKAHAAKTYLTKSGTAPAAGLRSVLGIDNAETEYSGKALFDATAPSTQAYGDAAAVGSAMTAARRDHKHAFPAFGGAAASVTLADAGTNFPTDNVEDALLYLVSMFNYTPVAGSGAGSDTYACDIGSAKVKRFSLTIADTDAKDVTFSNVPTGRCEVELEITTSAVGSVTWTLNGGTVNWQGRSAPVLPSGLTHNLKFITSNSGTSWQAFVSAGINV